MESKGRGRHWPGFYRTPIENQPKLIEFFSPRPWLEYGVIRKEDFPLKQRAEEFLTTFIHHFGREIVEEAAEKEEGPELFQMKADATKGVTQKIAREITGEMSESELEDFRRDHFFYGPPDILWELIFGNLWSLFCLADGRATMDKPTFNHYMWQIKTLNNIMKGKAKSSILFEALKSYINKYPVNSEKPTDKLLIEGLFKPKILELRENMERLLFVKKSRIAKRLKNTSALREFIVQSYNTLVDALEAKGIATRCKNCERLIASTGTTRSYCYPDVEGWDCRKSYWNKKDYGKHQEERRKYYKSEMKETRKDMKSRQNKTTTPEK